MAKLWEKDYKLDRMIEAFTVGDDWQLDMRLVNADCVASMAHATMLRRIGLLAAAEHDGITRELATIIADNDAGRFSIAPSDEDCHTAIEARLISAIGDAGKKIHTGRSRNDQVLAALRLWMRDFLFVFEEACLGLAGTLLAFAERHAKVPMPGRTHMQVAMPSSVGLWAAAHAEELLDELALEQAAFAIVDSSPLGSAAGYGVPLPLDRELVSGLLGFARVQNNVLYAGNSRGRFESMVLAAVEQVALTLARMAEDLLLYSMPEFGWFSLPRELCTGSSIMPQKRNPDGLELVRAKAAQIAADLDGVKATLRGLPSGYNRDSQLTKGPFFRGCETGLACVRIMDLTVSRLGVNERRLAASFPPEIFAADRAMELVAEGTPFRDAYREVAKSLDSLKSRDPSAALAARTSTGTSGNLRLDVPRGQAGKLAEASRLRRATVSQALQKLVGREVALFRDPLSAS